MSTKVKGLLRGLKHISQQIFDEKEEEFQIGLPTDVKHVAHIGSDDPSANAPSWMTGFKGGNEPPSGNAKEGDNNSSHDKPKGTKSRHLIPKSRHQSMDTESNASKPRTTRRHHRSSDPTADSSNQESSTGSSRHRRHRRGSNHGGDTASQEMPPSGARARRKSKNSEDGSVSKPSSRRSSKGDSMSDISVTDFGSDSGRGPDSGIAAQ